MTIEQAWLIVLDHYHDLLPAELQWRPGTFCRADKYWDRVYDEDSYIGLKCLACGLINRDGVITHDIPAPALTDAAAMAVLRAAVISFREELCADIIVFTDWYQITFRDVRAPYIQEMEPRQMASMRDPEFKVAAILAAAELALALKERAK